LQIDNRPQRPADKALNFMRAPSDSPFARFPWGAGESSPRQHAVLAGNPSFAGVAQESRHSLLDRSGTNHARMSHFDHRRSLGHAVVVRSNPYRTHLFWGAIVTAKRRHGDVYFNHARYRNPVIG